MLTAPERWEEHMEAWVDIPTETSSKRTPLGGESARVRGGLPAHLLPCPHPVPHSREELGIVMGQPGQQLLLAPAQEPLQRSPGTATHCEQVCLAPDLHCQQGHSHSQGLEELGGAHGCGIRDSLDRGSRDTAKPSTGQGGMVPGRSWH